MFPWKPSFWTWVCQTATCQPGLSNMPGLSQWTSTSSAEVEGGDPCSGAVENSPFRSNGTTVRYDYPTPKTKHPSTPNVYQHRLFWKQLPNANHLAIFRLGENGRESLKHRTWTRYHLGWPACFGSGTSRDLRWNVAKVKVVSWGAIFFQVKGTFQNLDFPKPTSCKQLVLNPVFFQMSYSSIRWKHLSCTHGTLMGLWCLKLISTYLYLHPVGSIWNTHTHAYMSCSMRPRSWCMWSYQCFAGFALSVSSDEAL